MEIKQVLFNLPKISEGFSTPSPCQYSVVVVAGFEDRTLNILKKTTKTPPQYALVIIYKGEGYPNKETEIVSFLKKHHIKYDAIEFDRRNPQDFEDTLLSKVVVIKEYPEVVIDISAMSKLLIMCLLVNLRNLDQQITIAYTEPKIYLPIKSQYRKKKLNKRLGASKLFFQTLDVSATVTTENLSSISMADAPRFLVAFPTFNEDLLITLFQEFSPNECLLVHSIPLRKKDKWRPDAIKFINQHVLSQVPEIQQTAISTYNYKDTFALLEKHYQQVKLTHKYIVGPPTSKLQAIAVALFKLFRQDVQILYPTPKSYLLLEHTKFSSRVHSIKFNKFSEFVQGLVNNRHQIDVST